METNSTTNGLPQDVQADLPIIQACLAANKPFPPEVARRIREHAAKGLQETLEKHGVQNIGVQILRELRGELPES